MRLSVSIVYSAIRLLIEDRRRGYRRHPAPGPVPIHAVVVNLIAVLTSGRWPSLIGAWLHFEVSFMVWLLVGALSVAMAEEFGLSPSHKGFLVALPLLGGALLRIPVGLWSDRLGTKTLGLWLLAGQVAVLLWGWLGVSTVQSLLVVALFIGVAGASFAIALPLAGRAYPPASRGLAMGVAGSANSGIVLALLLAPRLVESLGWRGVFGLMAPAVLATLGIFAWLVEPDRRQREQARSTSVGDACGILARERPLYGLCGLYAVTFGGFVGLSSCLPIFFRDQYGLALVEAGTLTACCGLGGSVMRPVGGFVADRVGAAPALRALLPVVAVLLVLAGRVPSLAPMAALCVVIVTLFGFGNGVVFKLVGDRFSGQIGGATGIIGAAGALGGFVLPVLFGLLTEVSGSSRAAFLAAASLCGIAAMAVWQVRTGRADELQRADSFSH